MANGRTAIVSNTDNYWTLNLTNVAIPSMTVTGRIAGRSFTCEHATLQGGALTLRQGPGGSTEPRITIYLFATEAGELRGQSMNINTNNTGAPRVVIRWADNQQAMTRTFTSGYALKLELGNPGATGMAGRIYLCLPDEERSYLAGTFNAEIRKASPPRPHPTKSPFEK